MKYIGIAIDRYGTEPYVFKHWYNEGKAYGYNQTYVGFPHWKERWPSHGMRYYSDEQPMPFNEWERIKKYPKITVRLKPKDKKK